MICFYSNQTIYVQEYLTKNNLTEDAVKDKTLI